MCFQGFFQQAADLPRAGACVTLDGASGAQLIAALQQHMFSLEQRQAYTDDQMIAVVQERNDADTLAMAATKQSVLKEEEIEKLKRELASEMEAKVGFRAF